MQAIRGSFTFAMLAAMLATAFPILNATAAAADNGAPEVIASLELSRMSLEDLGKIEITSVSKKQERLDDAAAAIYVITQEDIRRSGATSIPEILRLAPNLQVAQVDASQYAISARGFNSTTANKLLVLIDGRSVYTPLFSGVFWDVQDVLISTIERIEVISGPGGTLWGANAVNGVINIIRSKSSHTQGGQVNADVGNAENGIGVHYGGKLGEAGSYRIYGKKFNRDSTLRANGSDVPDAWHQERAGFRTDWSTNGDEFTLQGDAYQGVIDQASFADKTISGGKLMARWDRMLNDGASLEVQSYFDHTRRIYPGTFGESLDVYDVEAQHSFIWRKTHYVVWGGGYRYSRDAVSNTAVLAFLPADKTLTLANIFIQDDIALSERLKLTIGTRVESNNYTGVENQPNVRLAWKPNEQTLLWSAISRVVRTPSRIDREFFVPGTSPFTTYGGGADFQSEKLTAYEIGYRIEPSAQTTFSVSTFYNVYDKLRSLEPAGSTTIFANKMKGDTYGIETWGSYGINEWWQVKAGYTLLRKNLRLEPGSGDITGVKAAGDDPGYQWSVRSLTNLSHGMDVDFTVRAVGSLPNPDVPSYVVLDGHWGWKISPTMDLSLAGFNLLNKRHAEFGASPNRSVLGRSVYVKLGWSF
jgi:iron complex outermembrane receptor protein